MALPALFGLVAPPCESERPPPIRWMRAEEWEAMISVLHEQGVIAERPAAGDLYTTRFLGAVGPQ